MSYQADLEQARSETARLQRRLTTDLDFRSVSKKRAKVPVNALLLAYGLEWRTEEFARNACEAFEREDVVTAILLTRGVIENAAAIWELMDLLHTRSSTMSDDEVGNYIFRLLMGHKTNDEMPDAVNVMSMLDRATKTVPGARANYEQLSEFAHPNWSGVMAAYIKTNKDTLTAEFGRNPRMRSTPAQQGIHSLLAGLAMFEYAKEKVLAAIPALVERVEKSLDD